MAHLSPSGLLQDTILQNHCSLFFCVPSISLVTNCPKLWRSVILPAEVTVNEKKINRPLSDRWTEMPFGLPLRFSWGLRCSGIISLIISVIIITHNFRWQKRTLGWVALFCCCFCSFVFRRHLVSYKPKLSQSICLNSQDKCTNL